MEKFKVGDKVIILGHPRVHTDDYYVQSMAFRHHGKVGVVAMIRSGYFSADAKIDFEDGGRAFLYLENTELLWVYNTKLGKLL